MLALAAFSLPAHAATLLVPAQYATIQDAINAATAGDEVVVSAGTYAEQIDFLGKDIVVRSASGAALTTITGGGLNGPLVTFASGEPSTARLIGFSIVDGNAGSAEQGGGIRILGASPRIEDSIVSGNVMVSLSGEGGAGVYVSGGSPTFLRVTFLSNAATDGPGSALYAVAPQLLTIDTCTFIGNADPNAAGSAGAVGVSGGEAVVTNSIFTGNGDGGASGGSIGVDSGASLTVSSSTFSGNTASVGAGVASSNSTLSVLNSTFTANTGGGVYVQGGTGSVSGSTFTDNTCPGSSGAGVLVDGADATITSSSFTGGIADGGAGAGVAVSGSSGTTSIVDCSFVENQCFGGTGAALRVEGFISSGPTVTVDRSEFINNGLIDDPGSGGASSTINVNRRGTLTITNSLLRGNIGNSGAVSATNTSTLRVINSTLVDNVPNPGNITLTVLSGSNAKVYNSILRGSLTQNRRMLQPLLSPLVLDVQSSNIRGGYAGAGNIDADPLFVDASANDYRLGTGSPSIDAGNTLLVPSGITLDLDQAARIAGASVDMGAYEVSAGPTCDGLDFNNDGIENDPTDIEAFLSVYSGGPCIPTSSTCNDIDFNNDGIENDPTDIESFLSVYSGGPCL